MQKNLVVLVGPTGIGKTSVGIQIAKYFNTDILSSDSRQIFKEMTIGTAVPDKTELGSVKHHFIQTHSIQDSFNASKFETEALDLLEKLYEIHHTVVMVGGSMLYVDAVCKGIDIMPDADPVIRQNLKRQFDEYGIEGLRIQLKKMDPDYYNIVDLKNPARIIHALEIRLTTGKTFSSFRLNKVKERPFSIIRIGLNCNRELLHKRINKRVDRMVTKGLEEEAGRLYPFKDQTSLNTVGYKEWFAYFDGEITKEKAIELIKRNSRRYARKQLTWFRRDPEMKWFEPDQISEITAYLETRINQNT